MFFQVSLLIQQVSIGEPYSVQVLVTVDTAVNTAENIPAVLDFSPFYLFKKLKIGVPVSAQQKRI